MLTLESGKDPRRWVAIEGGILPFIGIDVGTSFIKGALLDTDGCRVEHVRRIPFPEALAGSPVLRFAPERCAASRAVFSRGTCSPGARLRGPGYVHAVGFYGHDERPGQGCLNCFRMA